MFAYCSNNPVAEYDPSGKVVIVSLPMSFAVSSLIYWLVGNGSTLFYDDKSVAADAFRNSPTMNQKCKEAIETYKQTGITHISGTATGQVCYGGKKQKRNTY